MNLVSELLALFSPGITLSEHQENEELFKLEASSPSLVLPSATALATLLKQFPERDTLTLQISAGTSDAAVLKSEPASQATFLTALEKALGLFPNEAIRYRLSIDKKSAERQVSVYRLEDLTTYLKSLDQSQRTGFFSCWLETGTHQVFQLLDGSPDFNTPAFWFSASGKVNYKGPTAADRSARKLKSETITHYGNSSPMTLFPEDLDLEKRSGHKDLDTLFDQLAFICCIIRLFDSSSDTPDGLSYFLNGYKSISGKISYEKAATATLPEYRKIVTWVYQDGNLSDKIGLARNIISLHLTDKDSLALSASTFDSIQSGYDVYLKDNIKQYIEIRSKIQDQLLDFNKRATSIIDAFGSGFQKSALAVVTFFASILVAKILSGGKFTDVFTFDAYLLTAVFLLVRQAT